MSERKHPRAMGQFSATDPADEVSTTIVGGQPQKKRRQNVNVPAGVERLLFLAATDPSFHDELMSDRTSAAKRLGLSLSSSELAMLRAAPEDQLRAAISGLDVSPDNLQRRRFMQAVAVAATAAAAGCGDDDGKTDAPGPGPDATGILADMPHGQETTGIQPDWGPQDVEVPAPEAAAPTGIRPNDGS